MKIFIRDTIRDLYVGGHERWVARLDNAFEFGSADAAINWLTSRRLTHVELVCAFPDPKYNFSLSLEALEEAPAH